MRRLLILAVAAALLAAMAAPAASLENTYAPPPQTGTPLVEDVPIASVFGFFSHPCVDAPFLWYDSERTFSVYDQGEFDVRPLVGPLPILLHIEEGAFSSLYPDFTETGFSGEYLEWFTFSEVGPGDGTFRFLDHYIYAIGTDGTSSFESLTYQTGPFGSEFTTLFARCIDDADFDLVEDNLDLCPGTELPDDGFEDKMNRYRVDQPGANFVDPFGKDSGISIADTYGCSGQQIADAVGGKSHKRFGPTKSMLLDWIADNA